MATRDELSKQRRDTVFAATWDLVQEKNFSSITLREVAERAGVALGTIFLYASTKDELLLQVFGANLSQRWDRSLTASQDAPPLDRIEQFYDDCLAMFFLDTENVGGYYTLLMRHPTSRFPEVEALRSRLRAIVADATADGQMDLDPAVIDTAYYGVFAMAVMEHMHSRDEKRTRALMSDAFALIRAGAECNRSSSRS